MGSLTHATNPYKAGLLQVEMVYRESTLALVILLSTNVSGVFVRRYEDDSHASNYGKREFRQIYTDNSHASNYGNRGTSNFIQTFNDVSSATNYGKRDINGRILVKRDARQLIQTNSDIPTFINFGEKREATDFYQTFNHVTSANNYGKREAFGRAGYGYGKRDASTFIQTFTHGSTATNYGKRSAQFIQDNRAGSTSFNYDCKYGGCGKNEYNQQYYAGSRATNYDLGKRK